MVPQFDGKTPILTGSFCQIDHRPELRAKVEDRVRQLEGGHSMVAPKARGKTEKYDSKMSGNGQKVKAGSSYNPAADSTLVVESSSSKKRKAEDSSDDDEKKVKKAKKDKKKKKKKRSADDDGEKKKKKKKKKKKDA